MESLGLSVMEVIIIIIMVVGFPTLGIIMGNIAANGPP